MKQITYRDGYKYQLVEDYTLKACGLEPLPGPISTPYIQITDQGALIISKGYAWDGPSGPTIDTKNFMRGSLVHDALYQLMRAKALDHETYREQADRLLRDICIEDGMTTVRAAWVYQAVRMFGEPAADPKNEHPPIKAP